MAQLLFFGRLGELFENQEVLLPTFIKTTDDLIVWLGGDNSRLSEILKRPENRIAVNKEIIKAPISISNVDEIAFMPPMSGG